MVSVTDLYETPKIKINAVKTTDRLWAAIIGSGTPTFRRSILLGKSDL
jgi:hypothetical protein